MNVEHQLEIEAPRNLVWSVSADIERWPSWTPTVKQAKCITSDGLRPGARYMLKQPMQRATVWNVISVDQGQGFVWETGNRFLNMRARHRMVDINTGVRNELSITASGAGSWLLWPLLRLAFAYALRTENKSLKSICERRAGMTGA